MKRVSLDDEGLDFLFYRYGSGGTVEIFDIAVNSERRKGIGRRLIQKLVEEVSIDCHLIYAITRASNTIAHEFYRAVGFKRSVVLYHFYKDEHAIIFLMEVTR